MEKLRMEYQKMIDQATRFYATLYLGIVAFFTTHVFPINQGSLAFIIAAGALTFIVAVTWWWKVISWNSLLKADIEYNKAKRMGFREYDDFIRDELEKEKIRKKKKSVIYPNFADDMLPRILMMLSVAAFLVGMLSSLFVSSFAILKAFR